MHHDPRVIFPPAELKRRNHISYLLTLLCAIMPLLVRFCWQPLVIALLPASFRIAMLDNTFYQAANGILELLVYGLPAALLYILLKKKDGLSATDQPRLVPCVVLLIAGVVLAYELTFITDIWYTITEALGLKDYSSQSLQPNSDEAWLVLFISSSFAAPVCEELLFRGAIFGHIRKYLKPAVSVPLCTLGFVLLHGSLVGLPAHICVGLILTLIMLRSENILYTILLHFSYNFTVTSIARRYSPEAVSVVEETATQYTAGQLLAANLPTILPLGLILWFLLRLLFKLFPEYKDKPRQIAPSERTVLIVLCCAAPAVFLLAYFGVSL